MFADTILGMGRTSVFESCIDADIDAVTPDTTIEECVGDPFEFLSGVYYESELNMTKIDQAIMVCEYTYLKETGTEMVYEANVVKTMFQKVQDGVKKAWNKICAFFKGVFTWLESAVRSDKKFVEKYGPKIKEIGSVEIKDFKGFTYCAGENAADIGTVADNATKMLNSLKSSAQSANSTVTNDTKTEDYLNSIRGNIVGDNSGVSSSDFSEKLTKYFRGKEMSGGTFSQAQLNTMLDIIKDTKKTKSALNVVYTQCKGSIDALLKTAKAAEKDAAVQEGKKANESDMSKTWHARATVLNSLTGITTIVNNKACKAITAQNRQCRAIIGKAVTKAASDKKDAEKKTATGESTAFTDYIFNSILG